MHHLLEVKNITKRFGPVTALDNISFDLNHSEIHCLVGENGAGKSTLIKILSGAILPTSGEIMFDGKSYDGFTPAAAKALGTETIYQENIICPDMKVYENIFLGSEFKKNFFYDDKKAIAACRDLIARMDINISPETMVRDLSPAQQKIVQVLKALAREARILILDEPTASFSKSEIDVLLELVKKIKENGTGIIFISHHLDEVFRIADRITVLKDGKTVAWHENLDITEADLISEMTGRKTTGFSRVKNSFNDEPVLVVKNYSRGKVVKNVSFGLHRGEILGFSGTVGAGRSELARLIVGADKKDTGGLFINGIPVEISNPGDALKHGICLLPEDRKRDAIVNFQSVTDNMVISKINASGRVFRDIKSEKKDGGEYIKALSVKTPSGENSINNLSGGNQQKVIIGRWMLASCDILIFDEPTRGIDVGAKEEIYKLMSSLAEEGKAIIMISSELPELIAVSDRVIIMKNGSVVGEVTGEDLNDTTILTYSIGGSMK